MGYNWNKDVIGNYLCLTSRLSREVSLEALRVLVRVSC
jgi:hypothetical protein